MTELLMDTETTPDQRDYLHAVKMSAEAPVTVINDILDFSKIEAGKLDLELTDFELRTVVGNMARTMAVRAHEKALKFTEKGAVVVRVQRETGAGDDVYLHFSVSDTCIGIPAAA
jgi:two-component system, sensor histidine kinase and response regulator